MAQAAPHTRREELIRFLDRHAFEPVLAASPDDYPGEEEKTVLALVQERTRATRERYRQSPTAEKIRERFQYDLDLLPAGKMDPELKRLKLPALPDLEDQFFAFCNKLNVR